MEGFEMKQLYAADNKTKGNTIVAMCYVAGYKFSFISIFIATMYMMVGSAKT